MKVIIPMAGRGERFANSGYTVPKPFIDVRGKPMIQVAVENLDMNCPHIFVMQEEHFQTYKKVMYDFMPKGSEIVRINGITKGPVCTCLMAEKYIDNDEPLIYANCDQYLKDWGTLEYDANRYLDECEGSDGGLLVTRDRNEWGSFATLSKSGYVDFTAEKIMLDDTNISSTGIYMFSRGSEFVKYAKRMIANKHSAPNGEFYAIDVYNEGIKDNRKYIVSFINKWWRLGVPEDLETYLRET